MYALLLLSILTQQPGPFKWQEPELKADPFIAKAIAPDANDSPLRKLMKERVRERAIYVQMSKEIVEIDRWDASYFHGFIETQVALWENLEKLMDNPADKVKCYETRVEKLKEFEKFINHRTITGIEPPQNLNLAKAARIDAEIDLLKLKESLSITHLIPATSGGTEDRGRVRVLGGGLLPRHR